MPETAAATTAPTPSSATQPKAPTPAELHEKAARCHEMAAALHHEAARFYADGDDENALECAKQAATHGKRANDLAAQLTAAAATH